MALHAAEIKVRKPKASDEVKVEGRVEGIEKARRTQTVMGLKIRITRAMKIEFD